MVYFRLGRPLQVVLVGAALAELRTLTDEFTTPAWGCNTYRALMDAFAGLERDVHMHVHLENNVLFRRALCADL